MNNTDMPEENNSCPCKNNYNQGTFYESFGKDDEDLKKCNSCPNMVYECGMVTCKKFS